MTDKETAIHRTNQKATSFSSFFDFDCFKKIMISVHTGSECGLIQVFRDLIDAG